MALTVEEILKAAKGELYQGATCDFCFNGYIIDSRKAGDGELFVPLRGERENGHKYVADALQKGAAGSLVEKSFLSLGELDKAGPGKIIIVVEDALKALQDIARFHRSRFSIPVAAITGSNGKTTTKDFAASVLSEHFKVLKTEGNLNNHIGLPLMLLRLENTHEAAVFELGMSGSGEIGLLTYLSGPSLGIITNIGEAHMEYLGSRENIARAKGELLQNMEEETTALLNGDDQYLCRLGNSFNGEVIYYGFGENAHLKVLGFRNMKEGSCFVVELPGRGQNVFWIPLPGRHNVYNALAAIGVGIYFELSPVEIQKGLEKAVFSGMRMEKIHFDSGLKVINDAYNASPSSMRFALDYLAESPASFRAAVLGDMLELGDIAEKEHLELGRYIAGLGLDCLITVGVLGGLIARGALDGGMPSEKVLVAEDNRKATGRLLEIPLNGSTVLLKGSRGMQLEKIVYDLKQNII